MSVIVRNRLRALGAAVTIAAASYAGGASASSDDVAKGEKLFKRCSACHSTEAGKNKVGPSLAGIIGRAAGIAPGYKYSALNTPAGENGLVWNDDNIADYLRDPSGFLKDYLTGKGKADLAKGRTKMTFKMAKEDQRESIAEYLESLSK